MLADFFTCHKTISYRACLAQLFFLHFGGAEIFLLISMAFDRYVAICKPLRYATVVNRRVCWALVVAAWAGGFMHSIIQVIFIVALPFCGPNKLDNFFCDVTQLIKLACTDTCVLEFIIFFDSSLATFMSFLLLLTSYRALLVWLKASSSCRKNKAASTCVTHIIVVFVVFSPAICVYCRVFRSFPMDKEVAVFHTMVFTLVNPMVYMLRNREILSAMKRLLDRSGLWKGK